MTGAVDTFVEALRQQQTGDTLFYRRLPPVFELRVPPRVSPSGTSFLFPLPMPPQELVVEYPFAVEISPTVGSGLVSEQNGVLGVEIHLRGTMGQRPKRYRGSYFGAITPSERRLSTKEVLHRTSPGHSLSGHRFLRHLETAVFGLYSDLKQDPEVAEEVQLVLHLPKDGDHYVVEPRSVRFPRTIDRKELWDYEIVLTGVEQARAVPLPTEDRALLAKILDAVASVRSAIRMGRAVVRDASLLRAEIEGVARQITGAVNDLAGIFEEVGQFVDGVKRSVSTSRARMISSTQRLEDAVLSVGGAVGDDTAHFYQEMLDCSDEVLVHPELFEPSPEETVENAFRRGMGVLASRSRSALEAAAAEDLPPTSERELRSSGNLPGDLVRDDRAREIPEELRRYRSAFEVEVDCETIEAIAAKYLRDARLWRHVAILNGLSPPYVSADRLPGTVGLGDRILIPSAQAALSQSPNPAVLGADPTDPPEVRELGVDWLVVVDPQTGLEDWVIDVEGGSTDLRVARGIDCFVQDLRARVETERGSDPLYQSMGTDRVLGIGDADLEQDAVRLRVVEAVEADPRVVFAEVEVKKPLPDALEVEIRVSARGLREPTTVQASTLPPSGP